MKYEKLSSEKQQKISETSCYNFSSYAFCDDNYLRRNQDLDRSTVIRPPFVRDIDKIIHCPYFNRYSDNSLGKYNAEIINNLITNIIENSYDKPYIKMDKEHFDALKQIKADNYELIYFNDAAKADMDEIIKPMMSEIFYTLLDDLKANKKESPIFAHHIDYINKAHYTRIVPYDKAMPEQIVVDYIASMTDDYFIELHQYLFPNSNYSINYKSYFIPAH